MPSLTAFKVSGFKLALKSIEYKGNLNSGEEIFYHRTEIWNAKKYPLDLYIINSSFMAGFTHAALVKKSNCRVERLIEVDLE